MLKIRGLRAGYGGANVLGEVDLDVADGEIVALLGANGAGKSTLMQTVSGLVKARGGSIEFLGRDITRAQPRERLRAGVAHVPEGRQVFAGLAVRENLELGAYASKDRAHVAARLAEHLRLFPALESRLDDPAGALSGGQQQMLAIARGLMSAPKLLLLDEPSLGLAPVLVAEIFAALARLRAAGMSILLAEQNARATLAIANRGYVLENGRIAVQGTARELLESDAIAERYLGGGSCAVRYDGTRLAGELRSILGAGAASN